MTRNNSHRGTDLIYGRGLLTAETIADELRTRLASRLTQHFHTLTPDQLLLLSRETLQNFEPFLASTLADTQLAAWVHGLEVVTAHTPRRVLDMLLAAKPDPQATAGLVLPPFYVPNQNQSPPTKDQTTFPSLDAALDRLIDKGIVTKETYEYMHADVQRNSFTVAGLGSEDTINRVRIALMEQIHSGGTLQQFRQQVDAAIGAGQLGPRHLETVFRTNVQTAFAEGQETMHAHPVVRSVFPYARFDAIHDGRVRSQHLALETLGLDGTNIYRADDPMWSYFTPPFEFNCRCSKSFMTIKQAAKAGVLEARRWDRTGEPPEHPQWRLEHIPFRPSNGFIGPGVAARAA